MSVFRFNSMHSTFTALLSQTEKTDVLSPVILKFILNLVGVIALLVASVMVSKWLFFGVAAGVLLVPAVIFGNSLTEGLGISRNYFE